MAESSHDLRDWIERNTTQAKFAREVGCSEPHLSDILNGKKQPSLKLAARMSGATGGAVPIDAFVGASAAATADVGAAQ